MNIIREIDESTVDILENLFDNIMVYNHVGELLYACDKFWQDTGLSKEKFKGKGIKEISEMGIYQPCAAELALKTGETATVVQRAFLDEISVATAVPIRNASGEISLYLAYAENNDRIVELEEKLQQLEKFIEEKDKEIAELMNHRFFEKDAPGESEEVLKVHKLIDRIADFDANVLLAGETGVGKTMYAHKIHQAGNRKDLPFVEINCAAIPESLLESELFGYEKGAFTGASEKGKKGQIEMADGGTLFLDEISELSMNLQSKLLKVIQDKSIMRIGGTTTKKVDFRLITATNKNLEALVREGGFRADLYYRLNVIPINVPALRDRKEDILPLARIFLNRFNQKYGEHKFFSKRLMDYLVGYHWPGNVRELENTIERLVLTVEDDRIDPSDLDWYDSKAYINEIDEERGLQNMLDSIEKDVISNMYKEYNGNVNRISKRLKMSRQSIIRRLEKYSIK